MELSIQNVKLRSSLNALNYFFSLEKVVDGCDKVCELDSPHPWERFPIWAVARWGGEEHQALDTLRNAQAKLFLRTKLTRTGEFHLINPKLANCR